MSRLISRVGGDGKRRLLATGSPLRLLTNANGAPCCCGPGEPELYTAYRACETQTASICEIRLPGSEGGQIWLPADYFQTELLGVYRVVQYGGFCYEVDLDSTRPLCAGNPPADPCVDPNGADGPILAATDVTPLRLISGCAASPCALTPDCEPVTTYSRPGCYCGDCPEGASIEVCGELTSVILSGTRSRTETPANPTLPCDAVVRIYEWSISAEVTASGMNASLDHTVSITRLNGEVQTGRYQATGTDASVLPDFRRLDQLVNVANSVAAAGSVTITKQAGSCNPGYSGPLDGSFIQPGSFGGNCSVNTPELSGSWCEDVLQSAYERTENTTTVQDYRQVRLFRSGVSPAALTQPPINPEDLL